MTETYRMPAEWEAVDAVLLAWPHENTDWAHMLPDVRRCYADIIAAAVRRAHVIIIGPEAPAEEFLPTGELRSKVHYIEIPTNDTWTRDYGAITTIGAEGRFRINDFKFNGWGLKFASNHDNLSTLALNAKGIFAGEYVNRLGFVLEGGSIESDGRGTILTTADCLGSPNRNGDMDLQAIEEYLKKSLNAERVLWLTRGALDGDDTDGHVDTLARILPPGDTIAYVGCSRPDDSHKAELDAMRDELMELRTADGNPYHLIELPLPDAMYDPDDEIRLPATYANFLFVNGAVLMPVYGQTMNDHLAVETMRMALPGYEIVPINCSALVRQHGSLHCATMQFPSHSININALCQK